MTLNTSVAALVKAMEDRTFDPEVTEYPGDVLNVEGIRGDREHLPDGTIVGIQAQWSPAETIILVARRHELIGSMGYRELIAELKTGQRVETAEDRVRAVGGVFVDQTSTTKAEQAEERRVKALITATKRLAKENDKAQRDAARAAKAAAKEAERTAFVSNDQHDDVLDALRRGGL